MATQLVTPSMADSHFNPLIFRTMHNITKLQGHVSLSPRPKPNTSSRYADSSFAFKPTTITKVAEHSSGLVGDETLAYSKTALYEAVQGTILTLIIFVLNEGEFRNVIDEAYLKELIGEFLEALLPRNLRLKLL